MKFTIPKRLVYCLIISVLCFTVSACDDPDNQAPIISNISVHTITENSAVISWTTDKPSTGYVDYGIDSPSLTEGSDVLTTDHSVSLTGLSDNTQYTYTIRSFNNSGNTASNPGSFSTTTISGNHAPVFTPADEKTIRETGLLQFTIVATDPDGDELTYSAQSLPQGADFNTETRVFSWEPSIGDAGIHEMNFEVSDGELSDNQTVRITVTAISTPDTTAPVINNIRIRNITANSADIRWTTGEPATSFVDYGTGGSSSTEGKASLTTYHSVSLTGLTDDSHYTFTIRTADKDGNSASDTGNFRTLAIPVNHAPAFTQIGKQTIRETELLQLTITATDQEGDALTYSAQSIPQGAYFNSVTQVFSWVPGSGDKGSYSATFEVSDGTLTDSLTINIVVTEADTVCTKGPAVKGIHSKTLRHDGIIREYSLYIPTSYDGSQYAPIVFFFHGLTGNASYYMDKLPSFRTVADNAGFILVLPQALNPPPPNTGKFCWQYPPSYWDFNADDVTYPNPDDVGFTLAMIDAITSEYCVDEDRIYASGFSAGASFSYFLAGAASDRITAIAPSGGYHTYNNFTNSPLFDPKRPMPVLHLHGTNDPLVDYYDDGWGGSVDSVLTYWSSHNNCNPTSTVTALPNVNKYDGSTVQHSVYDGCDSNVTVEHYKIVNGGHELHGSDWPGNKDFNLMQVMWDFFSQFTIED